LNSTNENLSKIWGLLQDKTMQAVLFR